MHEISGNGWTVLENDVYGTTYTHENAPTPYQFSYRVFAIAADGCNGSSSTFYNACNESNILHVVSLPNAESGAVNSSCNNSDLDDCGYFDSADTTPPVITIPELTTDQWGNENLELSMSGTTNFPTGSWTLDVTDNVGVADSACWAQSGYGGGDDPENPWISSTQSYDFSKITNPPSGQKFPIGHTQISCAAYDAAGNRSESNFRVVVTHDDPTGFVQYVDKPNSFGNTPDSTTKIFYSATSAQSLHLLKPIADLLTASNTQGMLARQAEWTLLDGAITIKDDEIRSWDDGAGTFYARMSGDGYDREIAKPLATMLTDSNMAGMLERNNPDRSWTTGSHTITISESSGNFAAMVKICSPSGGGTSCQENHVLKPFADMLNESNLNQAMFERSNMKILDAGGPAASATESSSSGTVSVDSLSIGQGNSKNGGDCDSVGTWVPSPTGFDVGGTCTLTKDIQITGTEVGITVASSGVTLDGAGHTVTGTQTAGYDHVGVKTCNQCYHMAIKNLEITNFAYGIFSNYAHGLIITGVTVTDVGKTAMSLGGSSRLIVEGNTIDVNIPNSLYGGINIHTNNAYAHLANGICVATDSMYSTNMIIGPWEWREGLVVIKNNVLNGAALSISEQDGYCIDGNTISDSPGMLISNSDNNMIKNNVITAGDLKIAGSGSTLDSNTVTGGSIGFS